MAGSPKSILPGLVEGIIRKYAPDLTSGVQEQVYCTACERIERYLSEEERTQRLLDVLLETLSGVQGLGETEKDAIAVALAVEIFALQHKGTQSFKIH